MSVGRIVPENRPPAAFVLQQARSLLLTRRRREVQRRRELYAATGPHDAVAHQSARLAHVWQSALAEQPFYQMWAAKHDLPPRIDHVADLASFPTLTKADLRDHDDLVFARANRRRTYSTGGSLGTPVQYPRGPGEALERYAGAYVARTWWGIEPGDPYVHLWGHSHQFGHGVTVMARRMQRRLLDRGLGAVRLNAYDMSPAMLEAQCLSTRRANPVFIAGYTSSVIRLARHAGSHGHDMLGLSRLKAVLVTSDTATPADRALVMDTFGVPMVNEYGSAETGAIAVSHHDTWPLRVLWDSVAVTVERNRIRVSTLHPRVFPLINYDLGDRVSVAATHQGSVLSIDNVHGRDQDVVKFAVRGGEKLTAHPTLPTHVLKAVPEIRSVQLQQADDEVMIFITADVALDVVAVRKFFIDQIRQDSGDLDPTRLHIIQLSAPYLTMAGKQLLMIPAGVRPSRDGFERGPG